MHEQVEHAPQDWGLERDISQADFHVRCLDDKADAARRAWDAWCPPRQGPSRIDFRALSGEIEAGVSPEPYEPSPEELEMMQAYRRVRMLERRRDEVADDLRALKRQRNPQRPAVPPAAPVRRSCQTRPRERHEQRRTRRSSSSSGDDSSGSSSDSDPDPPLGGRLTAACRRAA